jgi:GTP cyclohydrolase II
VSLTESSPTYAPVAAPVPSSIAIQLPTPFGVFAAHGFERPSGHVYLALVFGDVDGVDDVLVRVHSECLTGDALGSLRCDCGVQLRESLRSIVAHGRGALVYATGHEGRGIGLMNKLRAYLEQEHGADTVDANHRLGLPADARDYGDAADVIRSLGIASVRLMTNNPTKAVGLRDHGISVTEVVPIHTAPHHHNTRYLTTKMERMGHVEPVRRSDAEVPPIEDATRLLGTPTARADRPAVVVKLAQSLDGRIATASGDSQWISSEPERAVSHVLRAACDAVIVGATTVTRDDPRLTVRAVAGASPTRVVFDSRLRSPRCSQLFTDAGSTLVVTTEASDASARSALRDAGVAVEVVDAGTDGRVDVLAALRRLRELGMQVVLVEGGATLVTSLIAAGVVDRLIVSTAPILLGAGVDAVGDLAIDRVTEAVKLTRVVNARIGDDIVIAGDVVADRDPA